jgi:hypothetical protein
MILKMGGMYGAATRPGEKAAGADVSCTLEIYHLPFSRLQILGDARHLR